jgi:uncharacterized protein DUF1330
MAKGYWVALVDVSDSDGYKAYIAENAKPLRKFGGCFLARGGKSESRKARPGRGWWWSNSRLMPLPWNATAPRNTRRRWLCGKGNRSWTSPS